MPLPEERLSSSTRPPVRAPSSICAPRAAPFSKWFSAQITRKFPFSNSSAQRGCSSLIGHTRGGISGSVCTKSHQPCHHFLVRAPEGLAASASVGHLDHDAAVTAERKPSALWLPSHFLLAEEVTQAKLQPPEGRSHVRELAPVFAPLILATERTACVFKCCLLSERDL